MSPCSQEYLESFGDKPRLDSIIPISVQDSSYCLDEGQDVSMHGDINSYNTSFVSVSILDCDSTKNLDCYSDEELSEKMQNLTVGIAYSVQKFNKNEYESNPIENSFD